MLQKAAGLCTPRLGFRVYPDPSSPLRGCSSEWPRLIWPGWLVVSSALLTWHLLPLPGRAGCLTLTSLDLIIPHRCCDHLSVGHAELLLFATVLFLRACSVPYIHRCIPSWCILTYSAYCFLYQHFLAPEPLRLTPLYAAYCYLYQHPALVCTFHTLPCTSTIRTYDLLGQPLNPPLCTPL